MTPSDRFRELMVQLGGISEDALERFFYFSNPFDLNNWTLNVIEVLVISLAGLALAHAVAHFRRSGDAAFIGVWVAAVLYCVAMELPIYFTPSVLGLDDGAVIFIHNEFSVGAFYGRMPLYILALYPALLYPAYMIVRQRGLFGGRWGHVRGAVCVGVVHHCFYEVFDHLGPALTWWLWDYELPKFGDVTMGSVPLLSQVNFALICPIAFAVLARILIDRTGSLNIGRDPWLPLATRTVLAGVLTPVLALAMCVNLVIPRLVPSFGEGVVTVLSYGLLGLAVAIAGPALVRGTTVRLKAGAAVHEGFSRTYVPIAMGTYLVVLVGLWIVSLPEYFASSGGLTEDGSPIGSLPYAVITLLASTVILVPHVRQGLGRRGGGPPDAARAPSVDVGSVRPGGRA